MNIGATIGASLAFLIGRYFAREAVVNWLSKSDKFQKLDQLTEPKRAPVAMVIAEPGRAATTAMI